MHNNIWDDLVNELVEESTPAQSFTKRQILVDLINDAEAAYMNTGPGRI
jgi:hypothetical protein